MLPLSRYMLPMCRWREDEKSGSGDILDWRSWQVLPSRYVMFQGIVPAADEEHGDLPRVFLQVLHRSQKTCLASNTCACWNAELTSWAWLVMPFRHHIA